MSLHSRDFTPWPEADAAKYRASGYWRGSTLGELFRTAAATFPDRVAVLDDTTRMTYAEMDREADRFAAGLVDRGLTGGQRVVVHLPNRVETVIVLLGLLRAQAVPVLGFPDHRESEMIHLHETAEAHGYVVGGDLPGYCVAAALERLRRSAHPPDCVVVVGGAPIAGTEPYEAVARDLAPGESLPLPDPAAPAVFLLSGGSTGLPKLIPRTHDDYAYNARAMAELCRVGQDEVYLATLPIGHNFPLACPGVLGVLGRGGRVVLSRSANPAEVFETIAREGVTMTSLVPSLAALWVDAVDALAPDLATMRLVQVGGAPLAATVARRVTARLARTLQQVFGMAEGLLVATRLDDPASVVEGTQGRPLSPDDELRIVDANDEPMPDGAVGELLIRGPYTLRGYFRAEEHNARAFTSEGFCRSGDLVRRTPEGNLVVEGRTNDIINRGGEKVDPGEIETHLRAHPDIADVVVVPVPDQVWGQQVAACLRLRDGAGSEGPSPTAVGTFLRDRGVAAYKWPQRVRTVDDLPLTALGKLDRRQAARLVTGPRHRAAKLTTEGDPMSVPLYYTCRSVELTATPLEAAVALADHAERTGVDAFVLYERAGVWHAGLGRAAEVIVTPSTVTLHTADGRREHAPSGTRPLASLEDMLRRAGIARWRAFGTAAFELGLLGTDAATDLDSDTVLVHLFVPEVEAQFGDGDDWVRALRPEDAVPLVAALTGVRRRARGPVAPDQVDDSTDEAYTANVATAVGRIRAGDLSKVILSREVEIPPDIEVDFNGSFLLGREQNTPARSFRVRLDGLDTAGFSPETVLEIDEKRRVSTQPLAGTRARDGDPAVDSERVAVLTRDSKEVLEHALSVKAAYSDLESICTSGSVVVEDFMKTVERGAVVHLASRLSGHLVEGASVWDAFAQLFPAVTVSGIPRAAACNHIHRVEPYRGLYSGAVLTVAEDGDFDAALVLRSLYRDAGRTWLRAGAGIVETSLPAREFVETCEKLRSVSRTIMTHGGRQRTDPEQQVITDVAAVLGVSARDVSLHSSGLELGLDSVSLMRLATLWSRPGSPVRLTDLAAATTIETWVDLLPADLVT